MNLTDSESGSQSEDCANTDRPSQLANTVDTPNHKLLLSYPLRQQLLHSLPHHSNASLPISKLHEELLLTIFQYATLILDDSENVSFVSVHVERAMIFSISHVCHDWRFITLNCPYLWSCIDFTFGAHLANTMVSRSKEVPLCFELRLGHVGGDSLPQFCSDTLPLLDRRILNLSRIQTIEISTDDFESDASSAEKIVDLLASFHGQGTAMRSICIYRAAYRGQLRDVDIPMILLPSLSTHLRSLELTHCRIKWESVDEAVPVDLTTLILDTASCPTSLERLCIFLSKSLRLKDLSLDLGWKGHFVDSAEIQPYNFPELDNYNIVASLTDCARIFNCLPPPANARVRFHISPGTSFVLYDLPLLGSLLRHHSLADKLSKKSSVNLMIRGVLEQPGESAHLMIWDGPLDRPAPATCSTMYHIAITCDLDGGLDMSPTLPFILKTVQVPNLDILEIQDTRPIGEGEWGEDWQAFFIRHPNIPHLRIRTPRITSFFTTSLSSPNDAAPVLPRLHSLSLNLWASDGNWVSHEPRPNGLRDYEDYQAVLKWSTERHRRGIPIQKLVMPPEGDYSMTEEDVEQLKNVGVDVVELDDPESDSEESDYSSTSSLSSED